MATIEAANTTPPVGQIVIGCVVKIAVVSGHITFYIYSHDLGLVLRPQTDKREADKNPSPRCPYTQLK